MYRNSPIESAPPIANAATIADIAVDGNLSAAAQAVINAGACDQDVNLSAAAQAVITAGPCDQDSNLSSSAQEAILGYGLIPEVDGHVTGDLSALQCKGTNIHNNGQGANDVDLTLPAATVGLSLILAVGETSANYLRITADTAGTMIVDGVAGKNYASFAAPTLGNFLTAFTLKVGAAYNWVVSTGAGVVTTN